MARHTLLLVSLLFLLRYQLSIAQVESNYCEPSSSGTDFVTEPLRLLRPARIGGCTYNYVRVSSNGYISFGPEVYLRKLPNFFDAPMPLVSLFGADFDHALVCTSSTERQTSRAYRLLMEFLPQGSQPPSYIFAALYHVTQVKPDSSSDNNSTKSMSIMLGLYWYDSFAGVLVRTQNSSRTWSPSSQTEVIIGYSFGVRDNPEMPPVVISASPAYSRFMSAAGYAANFSQFEPLTRNFSYEASQISATAFTNFATTPASGQAQCDSSSAVARWTSFVDSGILFPYATDENPYNISGQHLDYGLDVSVVVPIPPTQFGPCAHTFAQIGSNGYIRLGMRAENLMSYGCAFAGSELMLENNPVIAVYAANMAQANGSSTYGGIFYSLHTEANDSMHALVSARLSQYNSSISFRPTFTMVVTYHQIALENLGRSKITAQLVLAEDSSSTYVFLNYANASKDLAAIMVNGVPFVFIGFSAGKMSDSPPTVIADLPNCSKLGMFNVANAVDFMRSDILGNTGLSGRWFYRVSRRGFCTTRNLMFPFPPMAGSSYRGIQSALRKFDLSETEAGVRKQYLPHCTDGPSPPSVRIALSGSVRFGTCSYSNAFISSFGSIVLGNLTEDRLIYDSQAIYGEPNYELPGPLIAPFITRMNRDFGRTSYAQFTNETSPQVFTSFQDRLARVNETSFTPTYALVVDWTNMRSTLDNASETISFQVLLLSDGRKTGLFFFYLPMSIGFQTSRPLRGVASDVAVGFTYGPMNDVSRFPTQQVLRSPIYGEQSASLNMYYSSTNTRYRGAWYWAVNTSDGDCSPIPLTVPTRPPSVTPPQIESTLPHLLAPGRYSFSNSQCMAGYSVDDEYLTVQLPSPIQLGGCNHTNAWISSNGYVAFSYRSSSIRPAVTDAMGPVLSPFNADLKTAMSQSICYTTHTENDPYLTEIVQRMSLAGASPMSIKFALVITWYRIRSYYSGSTPPSSGSAFTFQVVLFSNGTNTHFFFTYDSSNAAWQNSPINVGYFYGTALDPVGRAASLRTLPPPTETRTSLNIAAMVGNTGVRGLNYYEPRFVSSNCAALIPTTTVATTANPLASNLLPSPQSPSGWNFPATITSLRPNSRVTNGGCLDNADDAVDMFSLSSPLPFGGCNHTSVYISTNGYITLTRSQRGTLSALDSAETPCLGPFMVDLHPQGSLPVICYTMHSTGDPYLELISSRNQQLSSPAAVTAPRFAVVVTYYRVAEYGATSLQQRTSFQIVLFTDGTNTSFYFNYESSNNPSWLAYRNPVTVGYTYGSFLDPQNAYRVMSRFPPNITYSAPMYFSTLFQNSGRGGVNVYNAVNIPNPDCQAMSTGMRATSPATTRGTSNLLLAPQTVDRRLFLQSECLPPRDDYIESIILPEPIPFGGCNHTQLHISVNGFATLTRPLSTIRPSFGVVDVPLFAPFNTDLDGRIGTASVCFSLHRSNDSLLRNFTERLFPSGEALSFQIKLAVIATWYNIDEYSTGQRVSFQLVLVTNGTDTYVFYVYEYSANAWTIRSNNPVVQGYMYGYLLDSQQLYSSIHNFTDSSFNFRMSNIERPGMQRYRNTLNNPQCKLILGLVSTVRPTPAVPRNFLPAPQISTTIFPNSGCLPSRDDFTAGITLLSAVPFGGCSHTKAFISTNGYVTLSRQLLAIRNAMSGSDVPVIAPLQTDLHAMREDTVCYSMHTEGDAYLSYISQLFTTLRKPVMDIRFALVVTYHRINEYASGGSSSSEVSFQVAIVTDGVDTRLLFIYDYQSSYLSLRPPVHVGYTFGTILDVYNRTSTFSELNVMPNLVTSSNTGTQGVWYYTPGTAPNPENCNILVNSNASVTALPPWMSTTPSSVVHQPAVLSNRVDAPLTSSPLAVCTRVADNSQSTSSVCRCRPPYVGDGIVCRGAANEVVMFPYNRYTRRICLPLQAGFQTHAMSLPVDISFGGDVYNLFSISNNGYIQFHAAETPSSFSQWPNLLVRLPKVIVYGANLVFYADLSTVCFRVYTANSTMGNTMERASQLVRNMTDDLRFTARQVMVVTFKNMLRATDVPFLSGRPLPAVTAQAVIISGGPHNPTYVNLNYESIDYVGFVPLRDLITENPLQMTSDAALAGFDIPNEDLSVDPRTVVISAVDNSRLVRLGNSTMINANAFDQLVGNTGILGSWLFRVDEPSVVDPVTRRANNPAPQKFSDVFEAARRDTSSGASCNETFTMYARIRVNEAVNALRNPLSALQSDLRGYYEDMVYAYGSQILINFFNFTQYGQSDLDVAIRVGVQCLGASDNLAYFKSDSTFRSAISFILVKHGFPLDSQIISLNENCWPPKTMVMYSDCSISDDKSWQRQLERQYADDGYITKFKRVYNQNGQTVVEFEIQGTCQDPLTLTPIRLSCANGGDDTGREQKTDSGSHNVVALAVILAIMGVACVVAVVYFLRKKYGRIDLIGTFSVRRSEADGFEVPCNNFSSS